MQSHCRIYKPLVFSVIAGLGFSITVMWLFPSTLRDLPEVDILHVDATDLFLGDIKASSELTHSLTITNTSSRSVEISDFQTSCGCTAVIPPNITIPAKQAKRIDVAIDLATYREHAAPLSVRITPVASVDEHVIRQKPWIITGRVIAPCVLTARELSFVGAAGLEQGAPAMTLAVRATVSSDEMSILAVPTDPRDIVEVKKVRPEEFAIAVTPSSDRPLGAFSSTVTLLVMDGRGNTISSRELKIFGEIESSLNIFPKHVALGAQRVGSIVEQTFTLQDDIGAPLTVTCEDESVAIAIEHHENEVIVTLAFDIKLGLNAFDIYFTHGDPNGSNKTARVNARYWGVK